VLQVTVMFTEYQANTNFIF